MPIKPKRLCCKSGCTVLTANRFCDAHRVVYDQQEAIRKKRYDSVKPSWHNWYNTQRWLMLRERVLFAYPYCAECIRIGGYSPEQSIVVDHIAAHNGDAKLFWDAENLQALCKGCHDRKTARLDGGFGNKKK